MVSFITNLLLHLIIFSVSKQTLPRTKEQARANHRYTVRFRGPAVEAAQVKVIPVFRRLQPFFQDSFPLRRGLFGYPPLHGIGRGILLLRIGKTSQPVKLGPQGTGVCFSADKKGMIY
jgi:hypothetical protein